MDKRLRFESEQFKIFKSNLKEALWGDLHLATRRWWKEILEADSEARMESYLGLKWYERGVGGEPREDSRNGWYERDYSTIVGTLRLTDQAHAEAQLSAGRGEEFAAPGAGVRAADQGSISQRDLDAASRTGSGPDYGGASQRADSLAIDA